MGRKKENALGAEAGGEFQHDWRRMLPRLRYHNLSHEMLVKAAKATKLAAAEAAASDDCGPAAAPETDDCARPWAFDCTAGMGEDSLILAAAGFRVTFCEYNPVVAEHLRECLKNALEDDENPQLRAIASRMELMEGDSVEIMKRLFSEENAPRPDLILLDPMFPERKKSSLVKKKLQLIQQLEKPCADEETLLKTAMAAGAGRIIVKRPVKGPYLAGVKPSYSLSGKVIRYDCIVKTDAVR
ncbi:class I SAM-dependent methyltransferase [[Clostridium] aminophilum]|uniref:16S rRNA (Guanine1516-N2)-methyltransferase n=1 Tax=[Clostridium] aminophilum TaxID=1526 RepID=A0A1I6J8W5_9FIRM|nr:class I SAM-dependent methyltransferase [[Clostridium] aminophilum]SFR75361.1 16S rRNA (guanine1516-N2)-methyltransferase [[Clostridium] aminophilum]